MSNTTSTIDNIPAGVQGTSAAAAAQTTSTSTNTSAQTGLGDATTGQQTADAAQSIPQTASEVPLTGVQPGEDVSFIDQVKGHAKMFAGKTFGNDKEVQQGAARIVGADGGSNNTTQAAP